ncbi:MAG: sugar porter family MFS transporter [Proteobacteria bacterium]|nr:sugar porter family MFS transporter [Pseudomonadota bacterium]
MAENAPQSAREKTTGVISLAAAVIAIGGLLFGYNATVIAGAILFIKFEFSLSHFAEETIMGASLAGALIGAAVGGPLADRFGRRPTLLFTAAVFFFGALACAAAMDVLFIGIGRALVGSAIGLVSVVATLYLAEVAPDHVRGRLVGIYMSANMLGVVCGYLVELAFDTSGNWRWMLGFPAIIALPFAIGVWVLPETPRWCLCNNRPDPARAALKRIRGHDRIEEEINQINAGLGQQGSGWGALLAANIRPALYLGVGLGILQRITGISIAFFYGPTIFEFAGMEAISLDIVAGLGVGIALVVGQVASVFVVDKLGRRPLLLIGYAGMVAGLLPLGLAFALPQPSELAQYMAVGGVMLLAGAWAFGPASITFLLISELYPQHVRGPAMSLATVAIWLSFLVVTFTFLTVEGLLGPSTTFWIYGGIAAFALLVTLFKVPETKGKSLEEISASLSGRH